MRVDAKTFPELAVALTAERKRQGLTRQQAAAVCNVSPSFIRDAESNTGRCSLARLVQYTQGLGLRMDIAGWPAPATPDTTEQAAPK